MVPSRDPAARTAGWLLLATAIAMWLAAIGFMLVTGRVEKRFAALVEEESSG